MALNQLVFSNHSHLDDRMRKVTLTVSHVY